MKKATLGTQTTRPTPPPAIRPVLPLAPHPAPPAPPPPLPAPHIALAPPPAIPMPVTKPKKDITPLVNQMGALRDSVLSHYMPDLTSVGIPRADLPPDQLAAKLNQMLQIMSHNGPEVRENGAQMLCCILHMMSQNDPISIPVILDHLAAIKDPELAANIVKPLFIYAIGTIGKEGPEPHRRAMDVFRTLVLHHKVFPELDDEREVRMVIDRLAYQPIDMMLKWLTLSPESALARYLTTHYGPISELEKILPIVRGAALASSDDYYEPYGELILSRPEVILAQNSHVGDLYISAQSENILATGRLLASSTPSEQTRTMFRGIITLAIKNPDPQIHLAGARAIQMIIAADQDLDWALGNLQELVNSRSEEARLVLVQILGDLFQIPALRHAEARKFALETMDRLLPEENSPKCRLAITEMLIAGLESNNLDKQVWILFLAAIGGLLSGRWGHKVLPAILHFAGRAGTNPDVSQHLPPDWVLRTIRDALLNSHRPAELQRIAVEQASLIAVQPGPRIEQRMELQGILADIYHNPSRAPAVRAASGLALARIATSTGLTPDETARAQGAVRAIPTDDLILGNELLVAFEAVARTASPELRHLIIELTERIHPLRPAALLRPAIAVAATIAETTENPDEMGWVNHMLDLGIHDLTETCQEAAISLAHAIIKNRRMAPDIRGKAEDHILNLLRIMPPPPPHPTEKLGEEEEQPADLRQAVLHAAADIVRTSTSKQNNLLTVKNIQTTAQARDYRLRVYAIEAAGMVAADEQLVPGQREWAKQLIATALNKSPYDEVRVAAIKAAQGCTKVPAGKGWFTALTSPYLNKGEASSQVQTATIVTMAMVIIDTQPGIEEWQKNLFDQLPIRGNTEIRRAATRAAQEIKNSGLNWETRLWADNLLQRCLQA